MTFEISISTVCIDEQADNQTQPFTLSYDDCLNCTGIESLSSDDFEIDSFYFLCSPAVNITSCPNHCLANSIFPRTINVII